MPTSLFSRLIKFCPPPVPVENFFTELIGYLFESSTETLSTWLLEFCKIKTNVQTGYLISTQVTFEALEGHVSGNRPDLMIKVFDDQGYDVLFLESKMGAAEGFNQLRRYAEILSVKFQDARTRTLVFATKAYDPRENEKICGQLPGNPVQFVAMRWHDFYHFLAKIPTRNHFLIQELTKYMEEKKMNQPNAFSQAGVIALGGISDALSVMNACLEDEVKESFRAAIGTANFSGMSGLAGHRYTLEKVFSAGGYCAIGFYFGLSKETSFPDVRLHIGIPVNTLNRHPGSYLALIDISKQAGWKLYDQPTWVAAYKESSLEHFLTTGDHVASLRSHFLSLTKELAGLVERYPALPWEFKAIPPGPIAETSFEELLPGD